MHPVLIHLGSAIVPSYSFMLSLAFLLGGLLFVVRGARRGAPIEKLAGLVLAAQVAGLVGARLLFAANVGVSSVETVTALSPGGFAVNGGIILALAASWLYVKKSGLPGWAVADWAAPSIALGIFITKMGCLLGGCCYGKPAGVAWAVEFPPGSLAASAYGTPHLVHPTQLYEGLAGLALLGVILAVQSRKVFEGQLFLTLGILYTTVRFLNDFVRGDSREGFLWNLTQTQALSIALGSVAVALFWVRWRAHQRDATSGPIRDDGRGLPWGAGSSTR